MAGKVHGKASSVTFSGLTVGDAGYTITDNADVAEVTDHADGASGFKKYLAGLRDWDITITGLFDNTPNTAEAGDAGTLTVFMSGSGNLKFSGPVILTSHTVTGDVNSAITEEWVFKGNGTLVPPA